MNKNGKLICCEDGIVSYTGNTQANSEMRDYEKKMLKRHGYDADSLCGDTMLMYNPQWGKEIYPHATRIYPAAAFHMENRALLNRVFNYHENEQYKHHRCVFLDSPAGNPLPKQQLLDFLLGYSDQVIVRLHPRQRDVVYKGMLMDSGIDLWELICAEQITDEHILIASYSTTLLTPKMMYDKEPYIIFMYRFMEDSSDDCAQKRQKLMQVIEIAYRSPEKVFVPKTLLEFRLVLRHLMEKR